MCYTVLTEHVLSNQNKDKMELFHTSAQEIEEIKDSEFFGTFLFFSNNIYETSASKTITYKIEVSEEKILEAESIFYKEESANLGDIVAEVVKMVGCDEDTAEELLSQRKDIFELESDIDYEDRGEISWKIQGLTALCAKRLGFFGASMQDEQGRCYMLDMSNINLKKELKNV